MRPSKSLDQSQVEESLLEVKENGSTEVIIVNNSNISFQLKEGMELGQAVGAAVVNHTQQKSLLSTESKP